MTTTPSADSFFVDLGAPTSSPNATAMRSRLVMLNTGLLVDARGKVRTGTRTLALNLFEDVVYQARVTPSESVGGADVWVGTCVGVKLSTVTITRSGDVFLTQVASPRGVFEVSRAEGQMYRVVEMNQTGMPTES